MIELVLAIATVMPIILLSIDSFLIVYAMQVNNGICKEAARLAASGDPRWALARAQQIVDGAMTDSHTQFSLRLLAAGTTVKQGQLEALAPYGGHVPGLINVTTEVEVRPLTLRWFLGGQTGLRFQATSEVPSTYVFPSVWESSSQACPTVFAQLEERRL